jgi:hypothetical protein
VATSTGVTAGVSTGDGLVFGDGVSVGITAGEGEASTGEAVSDGRARGVALISGVA